MKKRREEIRRIATGFLKQFGLARWELTRIHIGIPKTFVKRLKRDYPDATSGFYACVFITGKNKFVLAVNKKLSKSMLKRVIAHEITHILLTALYENALSGRQKAKLTIANLANDE